MASTTYVCKSVYPFMVTQDPMDTLSRQDRFCYNSDGFQTIVPNPTHGDKPYLLYPRVRSAELRAHVLPEPRLTRGGHLSTHQPKPVKDQPYTFFLAQLIHYGLEFEWSKDAAKLSLGRAIQAQTLRVPKHILQLEQRLKRQWKEQPDDTIRVEVPPIDESSDEVEDEIEVRCVNSEEYLEDNGFDEVSDMEASDSEAANESNEYVSDEHPDSDQQTDDAGVDQAPGQALPYIGVGSTNLEDAKDSDKEYMIVGQAAKTDNGRGDQTGPRLDIELAMTEDSDSSEADSTDTDVALQNSSKPKQSHTSASSQSVKDDPSGIQLRRTTRTSSGNPLLIPGESTRILGVKRKYVPAKNPSKASPLIDSAKLNITEATKQRRAVTVTYMNATLNPSSRVERENHRQSSIRSMGEASKPQWVLINDEADQGTPEPETWVVRPSKAASSPTQEGQSIDLPKTGGNSAVMGSPGAAKNIGKKTSGSKFPVPFPNPASKAPKTARELNGIIHVGSASGTANIDGASGTDDSEWANWKMPIWKQQKTN